MNPRRRLDRLYAIAGRVRYIGGSVAEQGSIFSVAIEPGAVLDLLRRADLPLEVLGPDDDWRELILRPRGVSTATLTCSLKKRDLDQIFFRRQLARMNELIASIAAVDADRQEALLRLTPHLGVCIGLVADPSFAQHEEFIEAMTIIARQIDGLFVIPSGFLDAESRPLLMGDGSSHPAARLPAVPDWPVSATQAGDGVSEAVEPPRARRVAERMYVLLSVAYRGVLDMSAQRPERQARLQQLADWFWTLEVGHELEDIEQWALNQPLGAIGRELAQELVQHFESAMVLAWSLGLVELPRHDAFVQPHRLSDALGLFQEDTRFVIDSADLRDALDIRAEADRTMAIHWRLREFQLRPQAVDFAGMTRDAWFGPIDPATLPLVEGDLAIGDLPINRAEPQLRARCQLAIQYRHRALNWLCGHHTLFSRVDTST